MFKQAIRYVACSIIAVATFCLVMAVLLFNAAFVTGAESNYGVAVSWSSALRAGMWPPSWRVFTLLLAVSSFAIFTYFVFFRAPRGVGVVLLFLQAVVGFLFGGGLGWFFIIRELETYHLSIDAEKLGEHWFVWEALGVWTLAVGALALIRIFAGRQVAEPQTIKSP